MFHRFASILLTMSLLSFFGCSKTSAELPASLTELRAEISIEDHTECSEDRPEYTHKSVKVVLRNAGGNTIERGDVRIEMNGIPMEFRVGQGNYYDRHPYYYLADDALKLLAPATDYRFVLVLPSGVRNEIGVVRSPAALGATQFDFPVRRPATGPVGFAWHDLPEPATVVLFRSDMWKNGDGTRVLEAGSSNDPASLRRTIGPGLLRGRSDKWIVPESFLATHEGHTLRSLGAEVSVVHEGRVVKTFSKQSSLRAERRVTLRMECADPE